MLTRVGEKQNLVSGGGQFCPPFFVDKAEMSVNGVCSYYPLSPPVSYSGVESQYLKTDRTGRNVSPINPEKHSTYLTHAHIQASKRGCETSMKTPHIHMKE